MKTFFLVSQVLSFRPKKQTSENVVDTTFNNEDFKQELHTKLGGLLKDYDLFAGPFRRFEHACDKMSHSMSNHLEVPW